MSIFCDTCGKDLTHTGNSVDYRVVVASQAKAHHADLAVTDMFIEPPIEPSKHFCDLRCLRAWTTTLPVA